MRTLFLVLPLALVAAPGFNAPPSESAAPATVAPLAGEDFAALEAEFDAAADAHKKELRRVKGQERRELSDKHPANAYWPRFEAAAKAGEGRALLWMVMHSRDRNIGIGESREEVKRLYGVLVEQHVGADWFGDVIDRMPRDKSSLGSEVMLGHLRTVSEKAGVRTVQARAIGALASQLARLRTPEAIQESDELFARLANEFADTPIGAQVAAELKLKVGAVAPDFTGKTIDGYEFNLEDYRGKVVLVDFYGFW